MRLGPDLVRCTCIECGTEYQVPLTVEQEQRSAAGELIQNVAPELEEDQRELLISGMCTDCFDELAEDLQEL